jgi:hypothetical protein
MNTITPQEALDAALDIANEALMLARSKCAARGLNYRWTVACTALLEHLCRRTIESNLEGDPKRDEFQAALDELVRDIAASAGIGFTAIDQRQESQN